jgi:membrane protein implicated in regulation of membrane protease activity
VVSTKARERTFARYAAFQLPGWVITAGLAWLLVDRFGLAPWVAALAWALFVIKDFALYPWVRESYLVGDPDPAALLIGRTGVARERLDPSGSVRIGAELWRAELRPDAAPIETGAGVRVVALRGLTLIVEPC